MGQRTQVQYSKNIGLVQNFWCYMVWLWAQIVKEQITAAQEA